MKLNRAMGLALAAAVLAFAVTGCSGTASSTASSAASSEAASSVAASEAASGEAAAASVVSTESLEVNGKTYDADCYGEFTQTQEPCQMGADLVVGSLIKNPGGGIAPTGGYIVGRKDLVELCAYRLNAPGLGKELGCTLETPRDMYLGFYYAPGVVCEAIKTAIYAQCMLELLGKNPVPRYCDDHNDIVTCFDAGTADALIGFCQGIQAASPVDSYAAPEPSPEPGYTDEVVMASGSFTQGSTIELSCDGPLREPYTCYLQGGLNFAASRAGVLLAVQNAYFGER